MTFRFTPFRLRSGVPLIGLGILMLLVCVIPFIIDGISPLPAPVIALFLPFGLLLIYLGLKR